VVVATGVAVSEAAAEMDGELLGAIKVWRGDAGEPEEQPVTRSAAQAAIPSRLGIPQR